jgi:lycopene beta-cyclase
MVTNRVRAIAAERGLAGAELREERGVLPIVMGGNPAAFWPADDPSARLGLRGGFFHPTTGYSFSLALQVAEALADLPGELTGARLREWSRAKFLQHWQDSIYFRRLNRMLFHAVQPDQRYRVFAHFYRLPTDLIARFYAGRLNLTDKLRILSGRPAVGIGAALRAVFGSGKAR